MRLSRLWQDLLQTRSSTAASRETVSFSIINFQWFSTHMKIAMGLGKTSPAGLQYTVKAQVLNRNRQLQLLCQRCPRPTLWFQSLKPSIHLSFHRSLPLQCQNQPQIQGISQLNLILLRLRQLLALFFVQVPSEFQ